MFNTFIMYGIILFFAAAGILGHWLRDRDPTEKWFKFYMRNYNQMKRWFQLDPNGGFYILWKRPEVLAIIETWDVIPAQESR